MESNEKTKLTYQVYNNYSCKTHHLHKKSISRVVSIYNNTLMYIFNAFCISYAIFGCYKHNLFSIVTNCIY